MKEYFVIIKVDFKNWDAVRELKDFTYPWQSEMPPKTIFKAYHDSNYLYFRFEAYGPKPLIFVENNNKLEVTKSERVELFFRSDEKMQPYYCLEMDPNERILDYKADYYREFDRSWEWPESLCINTNIEAERYTLEGKVSLSTLKQLGLLKDNKIEVGVFRGHCTALNEDKANIKWISWIDSKTKEPDFHVPSAFGLFVLEDN